MKTPANLCEEDKIVIEDLNFIDYAFALLVNAISLVQKTIEQRRRKRRARALTTAAITVASIGVLLWIGRKS